MFPVSQTGATLTFSYKYEAKNLIQTMKRLELYVLNSIKRNKKICDGVQVKIGAQDMALSDERVATYV